MSRLVGLCVVTVATAAGCAKLDLPPEPAPGCATSVALDGTGTASAMMVDPLSLGSADVCMHLDATKNIASAHLAITVGTMQDGTATAFRSMLVDESGAVIMNGWDVAVDARVFHDLEWSLEAGEIRDVTLHVSKTGAIVKTPLQVSLFEPLE